MILSERPLAILLASGIVFLFIPGYIFPQSLEDSLSNDYEFKLVNEKGLDLDRWHNTMEYNDDFSSGTRLILWHSLDVMLHHPPGFHRQWKIDEQMRFSLSHPISGSLVGIVKGGVETFSDEQAHRFVDDFRFNPFTPSDHQDISTSFSEDYNAENKMRSWHLSAGGAYTTEDIFRVDGSVGPLFDFRSGREQQGIRYTAGLEGGNLIKGFSSWGWLEALPSGKDFSWKVALVNEHNLTGESVDIYSVSWSQSEQREIPLSSGSVNRRTDELLHLTNWLSTGESTPVALIWKSELFRQSSSHRGAFVDYSDLESTWSNCIEFGWLKSSFEGIMTAEVDMQEQVYAGSLSQGLRTLIGTSTTYRRNSQDTVLFKAAVIKYKYDTPDESDYNDRDEMRYQLSLHGGKKITEQVGIRLSLESDLRHLVYIYRSRSGENRWERTFRLTASVPWCDSGIRNIARFAVISRFADYDYQPASNSLSRIYRSFTASDSLQIGILDNLDIRINASFVKDDHGRLRWKDWVEDVSEEGTSYALAVAPTLSWKGLNAQVGWGLNHRETTRFVKNHETVAGEYIRSHGPLFSVVLGGYHSFQIELTGRIWWVTDRLRGNYRLPDLHGSLLWTIG